MAGVTTGAAPSGVSLTGVLEVRLRGVPWDFGDLGGTPVTGPGLASTSPSWVRFATHMDEVGISLFRQAGLSVR